jgi:hypothetical protein
MLLLGAACGGAGTASTSPEAPAAQPARLNVVATDFGFALDRPSIPAGEVSTTLDNEGRQPHQVGYYRLDDGVDYETFVKEVVKDDSMIPQLAEGGRAGVLRAIYPGDSYVRPSDELTAGTYALICSIKDARSGRMHYELGMIERLEIE